MKKLLLLALLASQITYSQISFGEVKQNNINIFVDPNASVKENGLLIGIEYESVLNELYLKVGYTNFMALDPNYHDLYASIGLNLKAGTFDNFRMFTGLKGGFIKRPTAPVYPIFGIESGLSHVVSNSLAIGLKTSYDMRGDTEYWGENLKLRWILSGFVFVTIKI